MTASMSPGARSRESALERALDGAVEKYRQDGDGPELHRALAGMIAGRGAAELSGAIEPYRQIPEIAGPVFERIVELAPEDARALVGLANAYWLTGRGPEVVGALASRAIESDPSNRAAWHLWSLSEADPRARCARWRQVVTRFPEDDLARASLADNLASLAGAEHDVEALDEAIAEYGVLLERATHPAQRASLEGALASLKGWRL